MTTENQLTKKDIEAALLTGLEPLGFSKKRGYGRYLISSLDDTFRILFDCGVSQRSGHILVNPIVGLECIPLTARLHLNGSYLDGPGPKPSVGYLYLHTLPGFNEISQTSDFWLNSDDQIADVVNAIKRAMDELGVDFLSQFASLKRTRQAFSDVVAKRAAPYLAVPMAYNTLEAFDEEFGPLSDSGQDVGRSENKRTLTPKSTVADSIEDKLKRLARGGITERDEGRSGNSQTPESKSTEADSVEDRLESLARCGIRLNAGRKVEELAAIYGRQVVSDNWAVLLGEMGKPLNEQFWPAGWRKDSSFQPDFLSDDVVELEIGMAIYDGIYDWIADRIGILMREEVALEVVDFSDGYDRRKPSELTVRIEGAEYHWEFAFDGELIDFKILEDFQSVFDKLGTNNRLIVSVPTKGGLSLLVSRATPERLRGLNALTDLEFFFAGEKKIEMGGAAFFKGFEEEGRPEVLYPEDGAAVMESVEAGLEALAKCGIKMRSNRNVEQLFGLFSREEVAADWKTLMCELGGELDEEFWPDDAHDIPSYKPGYLSDDIFHFDTETADCEGMYAEIAKRIGIMMREEIVLEVTDYFDGISTETNSSITIKVNGVEHRWEFPFQDDWIDLRILDYFQALFEKLETSARLIVVNTHGQDVLLSVGSADRLRCLNELTGLEFFLFGDKPLEMST